MHISSIKFVYFEEQDHLNCTRTRMYVIMFPAAEAKTAILNFVTKHADISAGFP